MKEVMLSTASLFVFCICTFAFFICQFYTNLRLKKPMAILFYIYIVVVLFTQFGFNIGITKAKCSHAELGIALIGTIFPWGFVFVMTVLLLNHFPGWKIPFSNTFGYIFVYLLGIRTLLVDKILKPITTYSETPEKHKKDEKDEKKRELDLSNLKGADFYLAIQHIYDNPSLFINEITPENYESFWTKFSYALFRGGAENYKDKLKEYIIIKDSISEFIWYLLSGVLSISISYAYINNATCSIPTSGSLLHEYS
jgi:hypothetical protein